MVPKGRVDLRFRVCGLRLYYHRVVAFAFGNSTHLTWDQFCETETEGGRTVNVWEADHGAEGPGSILSGRMEVVTRAQNRERWAQESKKSKKRKRP